MIPLLPKSEISSIKSSVAVQPGFVRPGGKPRKHDEVHVMPLVFISKTASFRLICEAEQTVLGLTWSETLCMYLDRMSRQGSHMSLVVRKTAFCICENKDADQLRGNREADQRLCFRYTDTTIPLLSKSEISSF